MFKGIIVCFLMLTIILFPIKLKITLKYLNKNLDIYIYNKKLRAKLPQKKILKIKRKINHFKSFTISDVKLIINKIMSFKLKPTLILNTKLEYGFDDAAFVAILFGLIHSTYSFLYLILIKFVKVKKVNHKIIPHYQEKEFSFIISSIIYTNLAKIIYMAVVLLICLANINIRHKKINSEKFKGGSVHG